MMRFGERNSTTVLKSEYSSEISDSSESISETNNISTSKGEWKVINKQPQNGLMQLNKKAFTVLCEPENEQNENREQKPR